MVNSENKKKKVIQCYVIRKKSKKSVVVVINRKRKHPIYKKSIVKRTRLHVHDEYDKCKKGDLIKIQETKPFSKTKSWKVVYITNKNKKKR